MADIDVGGGDSGHKKGPGVKKAKKLSTRVDMTPMVDLGFLLITFFIFTTSMSQPTTMNLIMPKDGGEPTPIKESGALTILPTDNGQVYYYLGRLKPGAIHACTLKEIRNVIINKKKVTPPKDFFVVIKPTETANYGNTIDILDEMTISDVKRY